jgi:hypothetical protein
MKTAFDIFSGLMVIATALALWWSNKHANGNTKHYILKLNVVWGLTMAIIWTWATIGMVLGK